MLTAQSTSTIRLQPNVTSDSFQVSGLDDHAQLIISDLNCIPHLKAQIVAGENILVDKLKKGVYIAKIITSTQIIERKLVKV